MPDIFYFISKYFWAVCIILSFFQFRAPKKVRQRAIEDRDFGLEHQKLRKNILLWMNIPWVIMGAGILSGSVPSVWHYFRIRDMNPFVLAFFGYIIILWIVSVLWAFNGGAEKISEHDLIPFHVFGKRKKLSPGQFKLILIVAILGGLIGISLLLTQDIPIPPKIAG